MFLEALLSLTSLVTHEKDITGITMGLLAMIEKNYEHDQNAKDALIDTICSLLQKKKSAAVATQKSSKGITLGTPV